MQLSIRLQNHGCRNHPYWWIVVAANRKNIKGRFIEHVGYWTPREGKTVDRQITLNMPRIQYWMGNGAIPTPRVQTFLHHWGILPKPFYVHKQREYKPDEQLDEKEKRKQLRKQKFEEREKLHYLNYKKHYAHFKSYQTLTYRTYNVKLREKIHASEKENQILRELLLHNEYSKISRINELSGKIELDDTKQLLRLEEELKKAKAELALLEKNTKDLSPMHKIAVIHEINALVDKIRDVEKQRFPFRNRKRDLVEGENVTKEQLDKQLEYELITKKIEKMNKDMQLIEKLNEVVTLEEYANFLLKKQPGIKVEEALQMAEDMFSLRGDKRLPPLTKYELYYQDDINLDPAEILQYDKTVSFEKNWVQKESNEEEDEEEGEGEEESEKEEKAEEELQASEEGEKQQTSNQGQNLNLSDEQTYKEIYGYQPDELLEMKLKAEKGIDLTGENQFLQKVNQKNMIKFLMIRPDVVVPTNRPVHPFPDLKTYVPEEYYEPISDLNLQVVHMNSLQPNDELLKYREKKQTKKTQEKRKQKAGTTV